MLKRYGSLILIGFFLTSCAHFSAPKKANPISLPSIKQVRPFTAFNQVDIQGPINVTLHTGYKKPQLLLSGDPRDLAQIHTVVSDYTLYLVVGRGFPKYGAIHADIQTQFLNRVSFKGEGQLNGAQLHTGVLDLFLANKGTTKLGGSIGLRRLDVIGNGFTEITGIASRNLQIHLKGNPKVRLVGVANITNLALDGTTWFSFYWLKSDTLIIRAKKASRIQLAGVVNRLDVELWGRSQFKGRYLRAQRSFVKTHDHAVAEISSVNHQSTLATDASDIYYYNIPSTRADFMAYDGSVLKMREWDPFDMQDFNRYNKQFP
jgi:Putative auto-transporter adhesin, head GIN domain